MKVELRYATLPGPIGLFAAHYWFVVWDADGSHRWEVWQTKNAGGWSIGHVHCDLKLPDAGVGGGPAPRGSPPPTGLDGAWQTLPGGVTPASTGERFVGIPARNRGDSISVRREDLLAVGLLRSARAWLRRATAHDGEVPRDRGWHCRQVCTTCWQPVMLRRLLDAGRRPSLPQ